MCGSCYQLERNKIRRDATITKNDISGISKFANARWMDTNAVLSNLRITNRNLRRKMNRLIDKYHKNMEDFEMEFKDEGVVYKYLNKVFEHMNDNRGKFTTVIMESVMRVL